MLSMVKVVIGFLLLVWGADWFVAGSSSLAKKLGVSSLIIGLTVVAFGTSAPELAVSITAGLSGSNEIALGNVLGSNLFNLLVVGGMSAIIAPLITDKELLKRDWIGILIGTIILFGLIAIDGYISRIDSIILLIGFAILITMQIISAKKNKSIEEEVATLSIPKMILSIAGGLFCIVFGGNITVEGASEIAKMFGLSETLIGLTIVAIGTSLPELVTSLVATKKGEQSIAIGNIIGSNIFNTLFILGTTTFINPIKTQVTAVYDTLIVVAVTILMFILAKKQKLNRVWGIILVLMYALYTVFIIVR